MDFVIQFQLSIFSVFVLGIIFVTLQIRSGIMSFSKTLLKIVIILNMIGIIMEPLTWIFDGATFDGAFLLEYSSNFILILLAPTIGGFMLSYVDYYIFKDRKRIFRRLAYFHPALITLILLIINMFYPLYFSVNPVDNGYSSGTYVWLQNVVLGIMYLYMFYFLIRSSKRTFRYIVNIFIFFLLLPIIGVIAQTFYSRLYFAWSVMALSMMVIYIYLETTTGEKDYLTKLYSRKSYEQYIHQMIEIKKPFEVLLIDLDNFKAINDQFGHLRGDQILVEFSNVLIKVLFPNKIICRLAGDEFMVVIENEIDIQNVVVQIYEELGTAAAADIRDLRFSFGCQRFHVGMTVDELYTKVDNKMYENKKRNVQNGSNRIAKVEKE